MPLLAGARGGGAMEGPSPAAFGYFGYMHPPTSFAAGNWQPRPSSAQQPPRRGHPAGEGAPQRTRSPRTPTRPPPRSAQAPWRRGAERACGSDGAGYQPSRPPVRGGAERAAASNGDGYQPEWLRGALSGGKRGASSRAPSPASPRANERLRARSRSPSRSAYNPRQAATRHQATLHDHTPSPEDEPMYDITDESLSAAEACKLAGAVQPELRQVENSGSCLARAGPRWPVQVLRQAHHHLAAGLQRGHDSGATGTTGGPAGHFEGEALGYCLTRSVQ